MAKSKIFVIEDEEDIQELIRFNLEKEGYRVKCFGSAEKALQEIPKDFPDLILLDLMLPEMDGLEACRVLKKDPKTQKIPIIIASAKSEESDVVAGLELGANDYVTKPFSPKVLVARVRSLLRHRKSGESIQEKIISIRDLSIDTERHEVLLKGKSVELAFTEFSILHFLASQPGRVYSREQIVDGVRGEDYPVTDRAVDVQIVSLRKKLKDNGDYIETVRGVGYRFRDNN